MSWLARIDSITNEHINATRQVEQRVQQVQREAEEARQRIGERVAAMGFGPETPEERAAREAREERDRLMSEYRMRAQQAESPGRHREVYVQPSDWTDVDEARAEGFGRDSWLV
ncbi:hypothetical protein [Nocardia neocaledoniensis]|jgi:hypothetical protein|uniref:hypothetical protein n=1 Tax=Nocardia neocaledoniensis TaxID=236511 RepID=UPI002458B2B3|nr:hypothetical protein [Nocardia neocaledoniensis]